MESGIFQEYEDIETYREIVPSQVDVSVEDTYVPPTCATPFSDSYVSFLEPKPEPVIVPTEPKVEELSITGLYLLCYHLPVDVARTGDPYRPFSVSWNDSLIAKTEGSVSGAIPTFWIGTVTVPSSKITEEEVTVLTDLLKSMSCIPIFLDKELSDNAYCGYCKEVLWPILHNVDQVESSLAIWRTKGAEADKGVGENHELVWNANYDEYFAAYKAVNEAFAKVMGDLAKPGDVIWVHDYHLFLLPKLLRDRQLSVSVVFFNHVPFPTSQILRSLPSAVDILISLCCADVVGFHAFDYARHFLNATKRMLGHASKNLPGGLLALLVDNRHVIVSMSHVSVEPQRIIDAVNDPAVQSMATALRDKHAGKKIVVSVDPCQRLAGGALRLAAMDQFFSDNNSMKSSVVLVQKSLRTGTSRVLDEATTSLELQEMVNQMNRKYAPEGQVVVDYEECKSLTMHERVALWLAADVFLLTSIREGLNMMPLEYILSRRGLPFAGVVVASEFSTCSSLLSGSLKINPFYSQHVSDTIDKAICMDARECAHRRQRDIGFVSSRPSALWTKSILQDVEQLRNMDSVTTDNHLTELFDPSVFLGCYEGAIKNAGICDRLSRLFVLDYGGTLLHKEKFNLHIKQNLSAISGRKPTG